MRQSHITDLFRLGLLGMSVCGSLLSSAAVLNYSSNNFIARTNNSFNSGAPSVSGGVSTSFSLNGTLPSGLIFNTKTGVISGTPNALMPPASFTVTAQNARGSNSTSITLTSVNGTKSLPLQGRVTLVSGFTSLAVQNAIDSASSGGTVYFPTGIYEITTTLNLKGLIQYHGEYGAILHSSSENTIARAIGSQVTGISLDGLTFDGGNLVLKGDTTSFSNNVTMINCNVRNVNSTQFTLSHGVMLDHIANSKFDYNYFTNSGSGPIAYALISYTSNHTSYSHNTIYNSHQGLHFESADVTGGNFLTVSHNTISGIDGIGIEFNRNGSNLDIQYNYLSNWRSGDPNGMALSIVPTGSVNTIKNNYASAVGCTTCNIGLEANGSNSYFENNEIHGFFNSIAISCAPGTIFQNNSISQFGKYGPFMRDGGYCSGYAIGRNIINGASVTGYRL